MIRYLLLREVHVHVIKLDQLIIKENQKNGLKLNKAETPR